MQSSPSQDEIVLFELPTIGYALRLLLDALSDRVASLSCGEETWFARVLLAQDEHDLARLLRRVQLWLETSGLLVLRFQLDGRTYMLESPLPALADG